MMLQFHNTSKFHGKLNVFFFLFHIQDNACAVELFRTLPTTHDASTSNSHPELNWRLFHSTKICFFSQDELTIFPRDQLTIFPRKDLLCCCCCCCCRCDAQVRRNNEILATLARQIGSFLIFFFFSRDELTKRPRDQLTKRPRAYLFAVVQTAHDSPLRSACPYFFPRIKKYLRKKQKEFQNLDRCGWRWLNWDRRWLVADWSTAVPVVGL